MPDRAYADAFMKLEDALKLLPNAKPRKARSLLTELHDELIMRHIENEPVRSISVARGIQLSLEDFEELFFADHNDVKRVTPKGAKTLIRLYREGFFELKNKHSSIIDPVELFQYCDREREINDSIARRQQEEEERKRKRAYFLENPDDVRESEFSYSLLNDIFIHHFGLRSGAYSMSIGGIIITKSILMYKSNSGKSYDSNVEFTWLGTDGQEKRLEKRSAYEMNRRNDSDRNWGLPE